MLAADMKQLINSMENTIKLQNRARAEKKLLFQLCLFQALITI